VELEAIDQEIHTVRVSNLASFKKRKHAMISYHKQVLV
jgi:hypothetical protein